MPGHNSRTRFARWIAKNGGEPLAPTNAYEFARFKACGDLCIIYEKQSGLLSSFQGEMCREAYDAWRAGKRLDLRTPEKVYPKDTWRDRAAAFCAIVDVRKGDLPAIEIRPFVRANNMTVRVLAKLACMHGLVKVGHRLVRAA